MYDSTFFPKKSKSSFQINKIVLYLPPHIFLNYFFMIEKQANNVGVISAIVGSAVVVAGSLLFVGFTNPSSEDIKAAVIDGLDQFVNGETQQPEENVPSDPAGNGAVLGDADAPVTIVEFSEFQCPYCGSFYNDAYQEIKEKYVDTGKVKIVFRNFPLGFHAGAYPAALAAECVREQGGDEAFFALHNIIFENQATLFSSGDVAVINEELAGYAEKISDIDMDKYDECVGSDKYNDEISTDMKDGESFGISGTPSFLVNGTLLVGAQPFSEFEKVIEAALAE
jgi:protein-disulfide isomerase